MKQVVVIAVQTPMIQLVQIVCYKYTEYKRMIMIQKESLKRESRVI